MYLLGGKGWAEELDSDCGSTREAVPARDINPALVINRDSVWQCGVAGTEQLGVCQIVCVAKLRATCFDDARNNKTNHHGLHVCDVTGGRGSRQSQDSCACMRMQNMWWQKTHVPVDVSSLVNATMMADGQGNEAWLRAKERP
jgi:hypothetical protein